jgi:hypothetical protein
MINRNRDRADQAAASGRTIAIGIIIGIGIIPSAGC